MTSRRSSANISRNPKKNFTSCSGAEERMRLRWFFVFFFLSGLCSLLYEVIWLRLAMAQFGVTTPLISIFLSIFMAGLGIGSWGVGRLVRRLDGEAWFRPLRWYAITELLLGVSAFVVPALLAWGRRLLEDSASGLLPSSNWYYLAAGLVLAVILLPWCTCMGATFPLALAAIRAAGASSPRSFSFLYLANVLGAVLGALLPAFVLVELFGFQASLRWTALLNGFIAVAAWTLSYRTQPASQGEAVAETAGNSLVLPVAERIVLAVLFSTGLVSMAMEVVWIRQFTVFLGTDIYAFALVLAVYLAGTFAGSQIYRRWSRTHSFEQAALVWLLLAVAALMPLLLTDPRIHVRYYLRVGFALVPFTALVGFLTSMLVDYFSSGRPERAGKAYAFNVGGCIIGPLVSGFLLLPWAGERWSLVLLALPLFAFPFILTASEMRASKLRRQLVYLASSTAAAVLLLIFSKGFEQFFPPTQVRRDYTATVIATGEGMRKMLIMNGQNLTVLTPATKVMAHLPLAMLPRTPRNALVICFGMGTTHRSMLSWGISSTAVELLPSVPELFSYFHPDGPGLLRLPNSRLVIDDGRMFLRKTREQYDVITIDPPPPIEAAGVSLLYSREFYEAAKQRLAPDGILQQWFYVGDPSDVTAVAKALREAFPYVRVFRSLEGTGAHFLASMSPLPNLDAAQLARKLPDAAAKDLVEWGPYLSAEKQFAALFSRELSMDKLSNLDPLTGALRDDKPVNEYCWLRRTLSPGLRNRVFAALASAQPRHSEDEQQPGKAAVMGQP